MKIKWILSILLIIEVLNQVDEYCQMKNQDNNLITIATGEKYSFKLYDYIVADDLVYQIQIDDSDPQINPPFSFMQKQQKYGIYNNDVIEMIKIYNDLASQQYYCLQKYTQDDQISYRLVRCQFVKNKEMNFFQVEFFIKRDYCYSLNNVQYYYLIVCLDVLTNQLELIVFNQIQKLYQQILINDIIIPPESKIKSKFELIQDGIYFGVLINKGRIENNIYISELSELYIFYIKFPGSNFVFYNDFQVRLFKQLMVLSQPNDYITDFAIYQEIAFITRFNKKLSFRNLKIPYSNEVVVENLLVQSIFGIHIPKSYLNVDSSQYFILLMLWDEDSLVFIQIQLSRNYHYLMKQNTFPLTLIKQYKGKSEKVFARKVISSNQYIIFSNDDEFSIFSTDFTKNLGILMIYQDYVKSKFFFLDFVLLQVLYEDQNVIYSLNLELPKITIIDFSEIQSPKLLQIRTATFDKTYPTITCPDLYIYYQVKHLNPNKIWPLFYRQTDQNVFILKYQKKDKHIKVDMSKVFLGQALNIEKIKINNEQSITASFNTVVQYSNNIIYNKDLISEQEKTLFDYLTTCLFQFETNNPELLLFVKVLRKLLVMICKFEGPGSCEHYKNLFIMEDEIQDLICQSNPRIDLHFVVILLKTKSGAAGGVLQIYEFRSEARQQIESDLIDFRIQIQGNILFMKVYKTIMIYIQIFDDVYTLYYIDLTQQPKLSQSIELNSFKVLDLFFNENTQNLIFVPKIEFKNYVYQILIDIYNVENQMFSYIKSIIIGQTKQPTKEKLYVEQTQDKFIILQITENKQDQIQKLYSIEYLDFLRILYNKDYYGNISIKKFPIKIIPTFKLKNIVKIKTSERFLYVYGTEIDSPTCIYIYKIHSNLMDILYHIIRLNLQRLQAFNVVSRKEYDSVLLITDSKEICFLDINPNKMISITKQYYENEGNNEKIELQIKSLTSKDEDNIQTFYIQLSCSDCQND